jgi:hypothetical protein
MNHFENITPENRWKNDMLNEQRETNRLLRQLLEGTATQEKATEIKPKRPYNRRDKGVVKQ